MPALLTRTVGAPSSLGDPLDGGRDGRRVGDVGADRERLAALLGDRLDGAGAGVLGEVDDPHGEAVLSESLGDRRADAPSGTGDDRDTGVGHGVVPPRCSVN